MKVLCPPTKVFIVNNKKNVQNLLSITVLCGLA